MRSLDLLGLFCVNVGLEQVLFAAAFLGAVAVLALVASAVAGLREAREVLICGALVLLSLVVGVACDVCAAVWRLWIDVVLDVWAGLAFGLDLVREFLVCLV